MVEVRVRVSVRVKIRARVRVMIRLGHKVTARVMNTHILQNNDRC